MTREIIRQIERDYWAEKADPIDMSEIFDLAQKALEQEPKSEWEQDHEILKAHSDGANEVLDKIRAEIEDLTYYCCEVHPKYVIDDVLKIIDKYKGEKHE